MDRHRFDSDLGPDPDPSFHSHTDQDSDPAFHFNADPDPYPAARRAHVSDF